MSLQIVLQNLSTRIATECKSIRTLVNGNTAGLTALTTADKTNLVAALNEVRALAASAGSVSDGTTSTTTSWSSTKVTSYVASQVATVLGGASAAYDTLQEIQALMVADDTETTGILTSLSNRIRFDAAQVLTTPQQLQGCTNIGVGDPETNFVTVFNAGLL